MKKSVISISVLLAFINVSNAQSGSVPGFLDDSAPGRDLGGTMIGSGGASTSSPGYSGSSATGTPGTLTPEYPDMQRQEDAHQNLNVPQTRPDLPQTQPDNSLLPGTGIGTGKGLDGRANGSSVTP